MISPNALYDSSLYAVSTLEMPALYLTGSSDCARSTFSNALQLYDADSRFFIVSISALFHLCTKFLDIRVFAEFALSLIFKIAVFSRRARTISRPVPTHSIRGAVKVAFSISLSAAL
jgi:hypothetical protein